MNPVNRHYDAITPFFRTFLDFENMPLGSKHPARKNLEIHNYESGHMIYLDNKARSKMKKDIAVFYKVPARPKLGAAIPIKPSMCWIFLFPNWSVVGPGASA